MCSGATNNPNPAADGTHVARVVVADGERHHVVEVVQLVPSLLAQVVDAVVACVPRLKEALDLVMVKVEPPVGKVGGGDFTGSYCSNQRRQQM